MSKVDELCDRVNSKYNLKARDIGSVERYTDMCNSAIVQITNKNGGYTELIYGKEPVLIEFLQNILTDKVVLYEVKQ